MFRSLRHSIEISDRIANLVELNGQINENSHELNQVFHLIEKTLRIIFSSPSRCLLLLSQSQIFVREYFVTKFSPIRVLSCNTMLVLPHLVTNYALGDGKFYFLHHRWAMSPHLPLNRRPSNTNVPVTQEELQAY